MNSAVTLTQPKLILLKISVHKASAINNMVYTTILNFVILVALSILTKMVKLSCVVFIMP